MAIKKEKYALGLQYAGKLPSGSEFGTMIQFRETKLAIKKEKYTYISCLEELIFLLWSVSGFF
jgi:hypothetical protein